MAIIVVSCVAPSMHETASLTGRKRPRRPPRRRTMDGCLTEAQALGNPVLSEPPQIIDGPENLIDAFVEYRLLRSAQCSSEPEQMPSEGGEQIQDRPEIVAMQPVGRWVAQTPDLDLLHHRTEPSEIRMTRRRTRGDGADEIAALREIGETRFCFHVPDRERVRRDHSGGYWLQRTPAPSCSADCGQAAISPTRRRMGEIVNFPQGTREHGSPMWRSSAGRPTHSRVLRP